MDWQNEIDELNRRQELAKLMGGEERVARQHRQGRLTVRERIDHLLDDRSFYEVGSLTGKAHYENGQIVGFTPEPYVMGLGKMNGRDVCIGGEDFTVAGGSVALSLARRKGGVGGFVEDLAFEYKLPLVLLIDGAGANIKATMHMGHTYLPNSSDWGPAIELLGMVPVVGAVLGSCGGGPAGRAMLTHWNIMVKGQSDIFAAGPPVVRRAIGEELTKAELGGSQVHVHQTGVIDNEAESEEDAFRQIHRYLSYMPQNVWELPPYVPPTDDPHRREEELLSIIPKNRFRAYDMRELIAMVFDKDSFFEIKPYYGLANMTGFARLNGYVVGVIASNPTYFGGAIDGDAADKQTHFIDLCDTFHIPLIWLVDVPGFMVGSQAERNATLRRGMRASMAMLQCKVPLVTVQIRRCYGMAGMATGNPARLNLRLAWPSGEWGSIPIEGGTEAAFRREIDSAADPAKRLAEIEDELRQLRSVFSTAEHFAVEEIIDPRDTRQHLIRFTELAQGVLKQQLGLNNKYGVRP